MSFEGMPLTLFVLISTAIVSFAAFSNRGLLLMLLLDAEAMRERGEPWRVLTSGWVHGSLGHLLVNLFSFWSFARIIEVGLGAGLLAVIYLGGIVGGSLLALYLHRGEPYRALGASGGVCAVIFASVLVMPESSIFIFPIPIPIPAQLFAFGFLAWTWWGMGRQGSDGIGHDAHFAGALVGVLVMIVRFPRVVETQPLFIVALLGVCGWMLWRSLQAKRA